MEVWIGPKGIAAIEKALERGKKLLAVQYFNMYNKLAESSDKKIIVDPKKVVDIQLHGDTVEITLSRRKAYRIVDIRG